MGGAPSLFYWIDHTAACEVNSGVQRVTRSLARALLEGGRDVVPVVWSASRQALGHANTRQKRHLAKWNGPHFSETPFLQRIFAPRQAIVSPDELRGRWLLVPEVTHLTTHAAPPTRAAIAYARRHRMRLAFVF